ncbi:hypothetical protein [Streptomyces sp. NPDC057636]
MIPVIEVGGTHVTAALVDLASVRIAHRTDRPLDPDGCAGEILRAVRA